MSDETFDDQDEWRPEDDEAPIVASPGELTPLPYSCAACGEINETQLDLSGGYTQEYVEDCTVCCRPNILTIAVDEESLEVSISNELEYDC
nr:cysteine-rich CPXCG [uncultured bacterium]